MIAEIERRTILLVEDNIVYPVAQDYLLIQQAMLIGASIRVETFGVATLPVEPTTQEVVEALTI